MILLSQWNQTSTRATCVQSSEALFNRLVNNATNINQLPFETIAEICYDEHGQLIKPKVKALIKLFRPDRNGYMAKIDFLNSIDRWVYWIYHHFNTRAIPINHLSWI